MSKMKSVVHFEMPYVDRERMAKFYQNLFGWQTQMFGEEMGNYVLAMTSETERELASSADTTILATFRRKITNLDCCR